MGTPGFVAGWLNVSKRKPPGSPRAVACMFLRTGWFQIWGWAWRAPFKGSGPGVLPLFVIFFGEGDCEGTAFLGWCFGLENTMCVLVEFSEEML